MAKKNKKGSRTGNNEEEFELPEGLELLETNGWGKRAWNWIKNNFSAIILPVIALIILGGGIYLYSQQKGETGLNINEKDLQTGGITIDLEKETDIEKEVITPATNEQTIATNKETETETTKTEETKPVVTDEGKGGPADTISGEVVIKDVYKETATKGEGITHLARKALKEYSQENGMKLSAEQKIYAEDYMQNKTGTRNLALNEEVSFSKTLINDAIGQAQKLTISQLHSLEQYSRLVPSLNY